MIGLIVIGHGNFASGMASSLQLITGSKENVQYIDFLPEDTILSLEDKVHKAIQQLEAMDGILVLCDLVGGSPFKVAVEISQNYESAIEVVGGMNLPMLMEVTMAKDAIQSATQIANLAIDNGKQNIIKYTYMERKESIDEEGI